LGRKNLTKKSPAAFNPQEGRQITWSKGEDAERKEGRCTFSWEETEKKENGDKEKQQGAGRA